MVLVRIAYVADLPTPDEAIRMLDQNGGDVADDPNEWWRPCRAIVRSVGIFAVSADAVRHADDVSECVAWSDQQRGGAEPSPRPQVGNWQMHRPQRC